MKILFVMVKEDYIDPMNVELLSALAKREGHHTFLNVLEHNNLRAEMRSICPDIVAYSAKTGESNVMYRVNHWIKKEFGNRILTVMGGPHPTFNHGRMQLYGEDLAEKHGSKTKLGIEDTALDVLAVGEADEAWPELLRTLDSGRSIDSLPNFVTRENRSKDGKVALRDRTNFLDDLPYLDRQLVYEKTRLKNFGMRSFMASRGCPFVCTYCFNAKFNQIYRGRGKTVNRYSVDRLLAELEHTVSRYPTQFIKFYDDVFTFRTDEWLLDFAEKYPKVIGLPFHCLTRADLVRRDPQIIEYLKRAGVQSISMSIEAGNAFVREHILKRGMSEEDIRFAFDLCHRNQINTFSNTILAIPAPLLPQAEVPDFEVRIQDLLDKLENYFKVNLGSLRRDFPVTEMNLGERQELLQRLMAIGLRYRSLDYDLDSLDVNLKNGVVFGEFPELFPYPGTPVAQYTIDVGAFDGDYEQLHQNYQSESPFSCFSEQEKLEQLNLSLLALVLLVFPRARNFAVRFLIPRRWTRLYFLGYFAAKAYLIGFRIYPMRYSLGQILRILKESFFTERLKHSKEEGERFFRKRLIFAAPTSEVLGGPWQS
jgi:anaerobic magnesium-protoporphyrin IX monomethyl ester cyclase